MLCYKNSEYKRIPNFSSIFIENCTIYNKRSNQHRNLKAKIPTIRFPVQAYFSRNNNVISTKRDNALSL